MSNATNTQQLVTLPPNIAAVIEALRDNEVNSYGIIHGFIAYGSFPEYEVLREYFNAYDEESERHPIALMRALVNGYQVEKSPEDSVRVFYEAFAENDHEHSRGVAYGIKQTINLLGIKIEGVNA